MKYERVFDLIVWFLIAAVGLGAAYVCFGILKSTASGQYQAYSVGGAIAGAIISWGILTSVYLQLRGSSNELRELRARAEELQNKLIRGAPRPMGFDTEVDERLRIVLARPREWEPRGGVIFDLQEKEANLRDGDAFVACFKCTFIPIIKNSTPPRDAFYANELQYLKEAPATVMSYGYETLRLGAESDDIESLKVIARQLARVEVIQSRETGRLERVWTVVPRTEYVGWVEKIEPARVPAGKPAVVTLYGGAFRPGAAVFVDGAKRGVRVVTPWTAELSLSAADLASERTLEISWANQDADDYRLNPRFLLVGGRDDLPALDPVPTASSVIELQPAPAEVVAVAEGLPKDTAAPRGPVYLEVVRMRVVCYHEQLEKIYYLEFWDDMKDFQRSSGIFNRILASTRFLD